MFHGAKPQSKGIAGQSIEPARGRLPAFVLQCIQRCDGYTPTQKADFYRVLYRCVSRARADT
ncbi:hypothetical protein PDR5_22340 [Pseudomonas sp. DR 5-09]|nr:hypothetical protein PDR5_22340 [Pseudomonas sp. DR 5-09]